MTEKKYFAPSFPLISICEKKVERQHQFKNDRENNILLLHGDPFQLLEWQIYQ